MEEQLTVHIERMGQAGDGVGRAPDGRLVFVPQALPGETVEVQVTESHKTYLRARVQAWLTRSLERVEPVCPVYTDCGGCTLQHWDYPAEAQYKWERVRQALVRIAGLTEPPLQPIRVAQNPWAYRNKGQFPVAGTAGDVRLGLFQRGTHQVIDVTACAIQNTLINHVLAAVRDLVNQSGIEPYEETRHTGILRHVLIRTSRAVGQALVLLVAREDIPALQKLAEAIHEQVPNVAGVGININPERTNRVLGHQTRVAAGADSLRETLLGLTFRLSFTSFFQVNPEQVEVLYQLALEALEDNPDTVWDIYAGVGTLAALAAQRARHVTAVELHPAAVLDARDNMRLNGLDKRVEVIQGAAEAVMRDWAQKGQRPPDAVIFDPPRAGLKPEVIEALLVLKPQRLVYISCYPETLARDLKLLASTYRLVRVTPVDMFPKTDHVESCAILVRAE